MADTREKLEVIAHLSDHITYKEGIGICYDSALAKVIEDAYMTLKHGVTVQEWISVEDRLPKDGVRVLALHEDGIVRIGISRGCFPAVVSRTYAKTFGIVEVTHWMPLPEPPEM